MGRKRITGAGGGGGCADKFTEIKGREERFAKFLLRNFKAVMLKSQKRGGSRFPSFWGPVREQKGRSIWGCQGMG